MDSAWDLSIYATGEDKPSPCANLSTCAIVCTNFTDFSFTSDFCATVNSLWSTSFCKSLKAFLISVFICLDSFSDSVKSLALLFNLLVFSVKVLIAVFTPSVFLTPSLFKSSCSSS